MKRILQGVDILLIVLLCICILLATALILAMPVMLVPVMLVMVLVGIGIWLNAHRIRKLIAKVLRGIGSEEAAQYGVMSLPVPVVILSGKNIIWYNDEFRRQVLNEEDMCLQPINKLFPGMDLHKCACATGQDMEREGKRYTVFGSVAREQDSLYVAYFVENTQLKNKANEYDASRPSYLIIEVDTYDEILRELKESERATFLGQINRLLEDFVGRTSGFLNRVSSSRYIAVLEERHMKEIINSRFEILDKARQIGDGKVAVTLSIGVGRGGKTLRDCQKMAAQALDMALGRGGDQAAVKSNEGFAFYGGVSRSVEKRSKVRSRIVAAALTDLIHQSDSVLIMGHKASDFDAIGAAVGMLRICKMCHKPAAVVVKKKESLAENLIDQMIENGYEGEFLPPEQVLD